VCSNILWNYTDPSDLSLVTRLQYYLRNAVFGKYLFQLFFFIYLPDYLTSQLKTRTSKEEMTRNKHTNANKGSNKAIYI
jgi:hypothetical protein